jgi:GNAT superfamily N-acetyltransferase
MTPLPSPEPSITFHLITADHLDAVTAIHDQCWRATYQDYMAEFCALTPASHFSHIWDQNLANPQPTDFNLLVKKNDDVIGFVRAGQASEQKIAQLQENGVEICDSPMGELKQIYLTKEAQGHGLGHRLFSQVATHLCGLGMNHMVIDVYAKNANANRFYQHLGAEQAVVYDDVETRGDQSFVNPSYLYYVPDLAKHTMVQPTVVVNQAVAIPAL